MRKTYITNIDLDEAINKYQAVINLSPKFEMVPVKESKGRMTGKPVFAALSSPHYNASAMDGIAVNYKDTQGAREVEPVILSEHQFKYVNTGNPVPSEYDAVIMIEDVVEVEGGAISLIESATPWQHIRQIGEDIIVGDLILTRNHQIRSIDLGAILSGGVTDIECYKEPVVGILPTGNEIVTSKDGIETGEIIDSNSSMLKGLIEDNGGQGKIYNPVVDEYETLKETVKSAIAENDVLIINAGSSAGTKDYTVHVIEELGQVVVHGVAIKPGKPTILGVIDSKPVIGIPGYPVSAYFAFDHFVKPIIKGLSGRPANKSQLIKGSLSKRIVSSFKHEEKVRVTLGYVNNQLIATPLDRGAGVTMSLVKADGIVTIPKALEGVEVGEKVEIQLLKEIGLIKDTLLSIGSHDLMMDIISDKMNLASGHVGSLGGIMALRRGECHIAPIHLLDAATGQYNISFIKRYFKGKEMVLLKGVKRLQGFMVQKGNPLNVRSFKDLTNNNIRYVNRQPGAGTRMLLDYYLNNESIETNQINGYVRELTTHLAVAIAIKEGTADTGLGVQSAARAMDLEFVPVAFEEYDFLMEAEMLEDSRLKAFIEVLTSDQFKKDLEKIGGYEFERTGEIVRV